MVLFFLFLVNMVMEFLVEAFRKQIKLRNKVRELVNTDMLKPVGPKLTSDYNQGK